MNVITLAHWMFGKEFMIRWDIADHNGVLVIFHNWNTPATNFVNLKINPKTVKEKSIWPNSLWFFQKCAFYRESETLIFVTFNVIIIHIFPENFVEIPQVFWTIWRLSPSILTIFVDTLHFFNIFLLQRN